MSKILGQAPANNMINATLYTQLVALIRTRQFSEALTLLSKHKQLAALKFEEAYIYHRMAQNDKALKLCQQLPQQEAKNQLL